jgi:hypothetical protein
MGAWQSIIISEDGDILDTYNSLSHIQRCLMFMPRMFQNALFNYGITRA